MSRNDSPQNIISGYQKRQKLMPYLVGGGAILLVIVGIIILVVVLSKPGNALGGLFATKTATPTSTFTPTATVPSPTPTVTPTETLTPTITETPTPSGPQEYEIQEGDTCWDIAVKYNVDLTTLLAINNFAAGSCPITPGQKILIPAPGQELPTPTLQDITNLPRNTIIEYTVRKNDSLESIASLFNSTVEAIMAIAANNITNKNSISLGMVLKVPVNLVTPTPTRQFTSTTNSSAVPTLTPIPPTATATVKP